MTGDNFECSDDFQPEFWPSEWTLEPQRTFGAIDAPDWSPAGGMRQHASEYALYGVTMAASRGME